MGDHTCGYCAEWVKAKIRRKGNDDKKIINRICQVKNRKIKSTSSSCKYFKPNDYFYCDKYNCWLHLVNCLNRRRNSKAFRGWNACRKCRQFETEVKDVISDYYIDRLKVKEPPGDKNRKIKRRKKKDTVRKIKRRKKPEVRKIKRRKKSKLTKALDSIASINKKPRKIKRRKK